MNWIYLFAAGIFEVVWATTMKMSVGFTKIDYTIYTIIGMIASFVLLSQATKSLPISLAYPIWTGIGAVGLLLSVSFYLAIRSTWLLGYLSRY
jgi:Membrane transporters of cations and cationic drugs